MSNKRLFLGIKQVLEKTFNQLTDEEKVGYVWFVYNNLEEEENKTALCKIYLGTKKYGEINDKVVSLETLDKIRTKIGLEENLELPDDFIFDSITSSIISIINNLTGINSNVQNIQDDIVEINKKTENIENCEFIVSEALNKTKDLIGLDKYFDLPLNYEYETIIDGIIDKAKKDDVYTKTEIDTKFRGSIHFIGTVDYFRNLEELSPNDGNVYMVRFHDDGTLWNSEFLYNGVSWIELGPIINFDPINDKINDIEHKISLNTQDISLLQSGVTSLDENIQNVIENVNIIESGLSSLETTIIETNNEITSIKQDINTINNDIDVLQSGVTTLETNLDETNANVDSNKQDIVKISDNLTDINNTISEHSQEILDLQSGITILDDNIQNIVEIIDVVESGLSSLETTIIETNNEITSIKQDINTINNDIDVLQSGITTIETSLNNTNSKVDLNKQQIDTVKNNINDLYNIKLDTIISIDYNELVTKRNESQLIPGQWYRITDYITTVANDTEARSAEHPFDLLVMATSVNTLSEEAKAINSSRDSDGYFAEANLKAWKIWYCLDNDVKRFQWVDTENGNGVIWRMIDEWQNDCPYDFKNVQFKRYAITDDSPHGELAALNGKYYGYNGEMKDVHIKDENDFVWAYTFTLIDSNAEWVDYSIKKEGALDAGTDWGYLKQFKIGRCEYNRIRNIYVAVTIDDQCYRTLMLNNIVLISTISEENGLSGEMQLNEFGTGNYNMTLKDNPEKNIFGSKCYNNIAGSYSNTFGNSCVGNTFGNDCGGNTFGNSCYSNTFGNSCVGNTFGNYFQYNTFGNSCYSNTFGNGCGGNTFGNDCGGNTFGNNFYSNTFGNGYDDNTFGNYFQYNTFGNDCGGNTFGNYFQYNTFGNNFYSNTFGNGCDDNTFGNGCGGNTFGNNFYSNTFGNNCRYITVHNSVQYVAVTGGSTDSSYVQNAQILNGTHGSNTSNRLQISFQEGVDYCQFAGLNSSGILKIWVPSDAA